MSYIKTLLTSTCLLVITLTFHSTKAQDNDILPPLQPWSGASEQLIAEPGNPWITPGEQEGLRTSPDYETTLKWLTNLCNATPKLRMITIGKSAQNREIKMVIATADGRFEAEAIRTSKKPTLLVQAGIHSGEIDGKDAGMMLLRDITFGSKEDLLEGTNLLFIPILNVDGHERRSPYNRVNQRGPEVMGWRTNARNLNLNRDYAKAETEGIQAILKVIEQYDPELYIDVHATDGADYQHDMTYGFVMTGARSPQISKWLNEQYRPMVDRELTEMGHLPAPLLFAYNGREFSEGNIDFTFGPRFSHAYGDLRHLPTILVENHSLKPYRQRVLGTYVFMEATMKALAQHKGSLRSAIDKDRNSRPEKVVLQFTVGESQPDSMNLLGIAHRMKTSEITGRPYVIWTGKSENQRIPYIKMNEAKVEVSVPSAYWVPAQWTDLIQKLEMHGIEMERIAEPTEVTSDQYVVTDYQLGKAPYEGRVRIEEVEVADAPRTTVYPVGSVRIPTDQPLGELVVILLDPRSPDSFFQWGFMHSVLSRTEYIEGYVLEPLMQKMLEEDASLQQRFDEKINNDTTFANNPREIYRWFYAQTPYFDQEWKVIPIGREWSTKEELAR
jgi:hypothetical protein